MGLMLSRLLIFLMLIFWSGKRNDQYLNNDEYE